MNPRRLYRSQDHQLAGVAGGMAEYLDVDPTIIRILWILVAIASAGFAILAYIVLAIVIPRSPYATAAGPWAASPGTQAGGAWSPAPPAAPGQAPGAPWSAAPPAQVARWYATPAPAPVAGPAAGRGIGFGVIVGVVLIVVGALALMDATIPGWVAGPMLGPAVLLTLGAVLLVASIRRRDEAPPETSSSAQSASGPDTANPPAAAEPVASPWDATDTQSVDTGSRPA